MKKLDYKLILSRLKEQKKFQNDTELASFLGTTQGNIANWKARNSGNLDQIISNCYNIDLNWLIFGEVKNTQFSEKALFIEQKSEVERLEETIELQRELIGSLNDQIAMLKKEIADGRDIVVFGKAE